MAKIANKRYRTFKKVTNQAFLLALGIVIVATLAFVLAILFERPVAETEGWKLLGLYGVLGLVAFIRWLVTSADTPSHE